MNVGTTILKCRHSVRSYKAEPVDDLVIRDALECARLAPSARNEQPWLFGVIRDQKMREEIAGLTDNAKFIAAAPVCFAVFGLRGAKYYLEDCCAATENLIIALQSYGVGSCWVAGEKKGYAEDIRKLLQVPEPYTLVSLVPAGYPADLTLVEKKNPEDLVFYDRFSP
jgi:nitroreductase